jgi:cell division protein ZapE
MSQHTFSPLDHKGMSPAVWYRETSQKTGFIQDASQAAAIAELDILWHELIDFKAKRNRLLGRSLLSPVVPKGIYFWGGVGRGKSFLMDVFFACVPYKRKRRMHFHNFMAEVHHEMKLLSAAKDPLMTLADNIAKSTRLFCFDEFHVSDIADAMILGRLLDALFKRGLVMIMTSNYAPGNLYPNGLQRQKFLPTIELLQKKLKIIHIESGNDYRLRELASSPLFMLTSDPDSDMRMEAIFDRLSSGEIQDKQNIKIQERLVCVKKLSPKTAWFSFSELCAGHHAQEDYLEIAHRYPIIFISGIPQLTANEAAEAQRFIWLIDVLYDNRVKLVASAEVPIAGLFTTDSGTGEFARTVSRLTEMQSQGYLELHHQSENISLN